MALIELVGLDDRGDFLAPILTSVKLVPWIAKSLLLPTPPTQGGDDSLTLLTKTGS